MGTIKVVCGLIFENKKILICRRKNGKSLAGYWEFPGGKVEPNERYRDCLERELLEELDMEVDVIRPFVTVWHSYETFSIELISFICQFRSSSFLMTDHDAYEWVNPDELKFWNLAAADIPIAESIASEDL